MPETAIEKKTALKKFWQTIKANPEHQEVKKHLISAIRCMEIPDLLEVLEKDLPEEEFLLLLEECAIITGDYE